MNDKNCSTRIPKFRRFVIQNFPFIEEDFDALTDYALICKIVEYLNKVIDSQNEVTAEMEVLQNSFAELKSYVDNYFDNLDVQEEINNKLEEMAEDGQLADIIAAYLQLKGVLAFNTVADIEDATNLVNGSFAKTYGYLRLGDGVYDLYKVRELVNTDVIDGYNLVAILASPTLVAERLDYGKELVIKLNTTDNIQPYLALNAKKTIIYPANTTIEYSDAIVLSSDTTLDLNGSTVYFNFTRSQIFDYDWDETLGFMSYSPSDTFTGYTGLENIIIRNGKVKGGCLCFMHNKNVLIEDIEFVNLGSRHAIQLAGCFNFTVKNCTFNGTLVVEGASESSECINIDPCTYGAQPFISEQSSMFDHTKNNHIYIISNTFKTVSIAGESYQTGVGSHGGDDGYMVADDVVIKENIFTNPAYSAINMRDWSNVTITSNTVNGDSNSTIIFIDKRGIVTNANIIGNITTYVTKFLANETPSNAFTNVVCSNNNIIANDSNTDTGGVFTLMNAHNVQISDNKVKFQHHFAFVNSKDYWDGTSEGSSVYCTDIEFNNNTIQKTLNSAQYWNIRIANTSEVKFANNNFVHDGTLQNNYYDFLVQSNVTGISVVNNVTDSPFKFMNVAQCTDKNHSNSAYYLNITDGLSSQDTSGTFIKDVTNFRCIILTLGSGSNTQVVRLYPYMYPNDYISARTYKFPVAKDDGTYGVATFTVTDGTHWSYTGNINIRLIHVSD